MMSSEQPSDAMRSAAIDVGRRRCRVGCALRGIDESQVATFVDETRRDRPEIWGGGR
jgi:hypothetical protein